MLAEDKLQQLHQFVTTFSKEELIWVNGYLNGLLQNGHIPRQSTGHVPLAVDKITLAYGTETGNAKKLASTFANTAKKKGVNAKLIGLDQYRLSDLAKEEYFFVIISTQGDGEPPAAAQKFYEFIHKESPELSKLKFGVLALGDSSYPLFCKTGQDVDLRLQQLGANPLIELQKCDVDYQEEADRWFNQVVTALTQRELKYSNVYQRVAKGEQKKSYTGRISGHVNLNDDRSDKETYHIEVSLDEQPVYTPGDAAGIYPHNKVSLVDNIIKLVGIDPAKEIATAKVNASVRELLIKHVSISYLQNGLVQKYAAIVGTEIPDTRIDLLDLLRIYPVKDELQFEEVIKVLNPIVPRLYSIASSPAAHANELHLTVAKNQFQINNEKRFGVCSDFLSALTEDTVLDFYIHKNNNFRLPDADRDIIMIGPGTGIAPFRSFVAERDATGATGKNWLFFGDRSFTSDFLYQTEWQQYYNSGVLTKINLAWSRDGDSKHYVQHELIKEAEELMQWIDNGAHIYLCGSKEPMSSDVEIALLKIIADQKSVSQEEARLFLDQLSNSGRYSIDVY